MTVLSDKTIKERIGDNELIPKGNIAGVKHCSYEFTASMMIRGGSHEEEKITDTGVVIKPAQLVWIRACEEITMPSDMVGLWIQTQTLSRDGLLLLNTTLIEPGYEGPLTAVLVNFGKKNVVIGPETKIAKVIFMSLDSDAAKLVGKLDSGEYDMDLKVRAANAPKTFIHLGELFEDINIQAQNMISEIDEEIKSKINNIVENRMPDIEKDLRGGIKGSVMKWGGGVVAGIIIGCGLIWLMISSLLPSISEYSKVDQLARTASIAQQAETITALNTQINNLATEVKSLKKQVQSDVLNANPLPDANNADPKQ